MSEQDLFERQFTSAGAAPGSFDLPEGTPPPQLRLFSYDAEHLDESVPVDVEAALGRLQARRVGWLDVQGLGDRRLFDAVQRHCGLHRLLVADVANLGQRPKAEDYGAHLFLVLRMAVTGGTGAIAWEQLSLVLTRGALVTFQERPGDCLDSLRKRLRDGRPVLRASQADYLACMVADSIVDGYFPALEHYGARLEELEDQILAGAGPGALAEVYAVRRELMTFRRAAWPLREALGQLLRDRPALIAESSVPYLRDAADHVMQVVEVLETYRELCGSLVEIHLSTVSNKTNEVMRVLTVIATIFIPLTFLAGIYGMNFDTASPLNMPELSWRYGYPLFWAIAVLLAVALLLLFRRMGWLGGGPGGRA